MTQICDINNDEEVASSNKHTYIKTRVQKSNPIYDQNGWKTIPFGDAHTYMAYIKEYLPSGGSLWIVEVQPGWGEGRVWRGVQLYSQSEVRNYIQMNRERKKINSKNIQHLSDQVISFPAVSNAPPECHSSLTSSLPFSWRLNRIPINCASLLIVSCTVQKRLN